MTWTHPRTPPVSARSIRGLIAALVALGILVIAEPAVAAPGDVVRTLHPSVCAGGNYGVAMKGKTVLVTCPAGATLAPTIYELSGATGKAKVTHSVTGLGSGDMIVGIGWDPVSQLVLACVAQDVGLTDRLGTVNLLTNTFTVRGTTTDCTGGLEYDQSHRLWSAPFDGSAIHRIDPTTGATIQTIQTGTLGGCGTSGLAVEGGALFVSTVGLGIGGQFECGIFDIPIATGVASGFVPAGSVGAVADLVCDNKTFAASFATAIWAADAASSTLVAREAPGSGGATAPKCR